MKENLEIISKKILKITAWTVSAMAIIQLGLSQFTIRMSRLSIEEKTGIALFAFIIFGMITVFAVSRMKEGHLAKLFAVAMNFATSALAVWYLGMLLSDQIFLQGLLYTLDRQTQIYDPLSTGQRILASLPLVVVALGALINCIAGLAILVAGLMSIRENVGEKQGE